MECLKDLAKSLVALLQPVLRCLSKLEEYTEQFKQYIQLHRSRGCTTERSVEIHLCSAKVDTLRDYMRKVCRYLTTPFCKELSLVSFMPATLKQTYQDVTKKYNSMEADNIHAHKLCARLFNNWLTVKEAEHRRRLQSSTAPLPTPVSYQYTGRSDGHNKQKDRDDGVSHVETEQKRKTKKKVKTRPAHAHESVLFASIETEPTNSEESRGPVVDQHMVEDPSSTIENSDRSDRVDDSRVVHSSQAALFQSYKQKGLLAAQARAAAHQDILRQSQCRLKRQTQIMETRCMVDSLISADQLPRTRTEPLVTPMQHTDVTSSEKQKRKAAKKAAKKAAETSRTMSLDQFRNSNTI